MDSSVAPYSFDTQPPAEASRKLPVELRRAAPGERYPRAAGSAASAPFGQRRSGIWPTAGPPGWVAPVSGRGKARQDPRAALLLARGLGCWRQARRSGALAAAGGRRQCRGSAPDPARHPAPRACGPGFFKKLPQPQVRPQLRASSWPWAVPAPALASDGPSPSPPGPLVGLGEDPRSPQCSARVGACRALDQVVVQTLREAGVYGLSLSPHLPGFCNPHRGQARFTGRLLRNSADLG